MFIECPRCHARAQLPDSKEGAKVRCSECSRIYEALPAGARGRRRGNEDANRMVMIGGVAAVAVLVLLFVVNNSGGPSNAGQGPPVEEDDDFGRGMPVANPNDWSSTVVQAARQIHDLAAAGNVGAVQGRLHAEEAHAWTIALATEAGTEAPQAWAELTSNARLLRHREIAQAMIDGEYAALIGDWVAYAGGAMDDPAGERGLKIVRLEVKHRSDPDATDQMVQWTLRDYGGKWKAIRWERFYPDGKPRSGSGRRKVEVKTLSDGTKVKEGVVRPIPYDDDVPMEMRADLDALVARVIDLDLTSGRIAIEDELVAAGKPAIAPLLTKLAEIPFVEGEPNIQLEILHRMLTRITGYQNITFRASEALGGTTERSESGLKQWFGWYDRRYKRFKGNPALVQKEEEPDPYFGLSEDEWNALPDAEKRAIQKAAREIEEERRVEQARREQAGG